MKQKCQCRSCGAAIRWVYTASGRKMPIDAEPASDGNLEIVRGVAQLAQTDLFGNAPCGPFYISHFATCPNARKHRKRL